MKTDYAKRMLDDPRLNFAISRRAVSPASTLKEMAQIIAQMPAERAARVLAESPAVTEEVRPRWI